MTNSAQANSAKATVTTAFKHWVKLPRRRPSHRKPDCSWDEVKEHEDECIKRRREWVNARGWYPTRVPEPRIGLALSGGGIRSATFSLGILRALSRARLLPRVDYLSTVSGGGYAGSFYCSLFVPQHARGVHRQEVAPGTSQAQRDPYADRAKNLGADVLGSRIGHSAVEQLRQGGNFLNPNGTSDALFAAVIAVRNWLAVAIVTGVAILSLFLLINSVRGASEAPVIRHMALAITPGKGEPRSAEPPPGARCFARSLRGERNVWECFSEAWSGTVAQTLSDLRQGTSDAAGEQADPSTAKSSSEPSLIGPLMGSSWLWALGILILVFWTGPCCWAYWLTWSGPRVPKSRLRRLFSASAAVALASAAASMVAYWLDIGEAWPFRLIWALTICWSLGGIAFYAAALARNRAEEDFDKQSRLHSAGENSAAVVAQEDRVRTKLSRWLMRGFLTLLLASALAVTDDLGRMLYYLATGRFTDLQWPQFATTLFGGASVLLIPVARWLLKRVEASELLSWPRLGPLLRRFGRTVALVVGLVLLVTLASFWSAVAYALTWHLQIVTLKEPLSTWGWQKDLPWLPPLLFTFVIGAIALTLGRIHGFLNHSSLASFYAGRLRKAYLGASNLKRIVGRTAADKELPNDDIELPAYYHPKVLAPVHLINVTVNETTSRSSRVIQRDRKGKTLTISPAGYIFNEEGPTEPPVGFALRKGEQLPLSTWMGISGAAFSTGMGQHSSLGLSLLAGLSNLRLGYWWDSPYPCRRGERGTAEAKGRGSNPLRAVAKQGGDLVQSYLLREIRGSFEGTHSNRWYLSDGGHYENTGIYELIRRRVRFIIACDNGADPSYAFGDLVNLIRKIRIDFGAETEIVGGDELNRLFGEHGALRGAFGTLEDMVPKEGEEKGKTGPYAALARIKYLSAGDKAAGTPVSTLLLIKPRVTGGELPDLIRYKRANVAFPQQPTTDQFFDEAQWESYYRLGQLVGDTIFADVSKAPAPGRAGQGSAPATAAPGVPAVMWRPVDLEPLP